MNADQPRKQELPQPFRGRPVNFQQRAEMRDLLRKAVEAAKRGLLPVKIPQSIGRMQKMPQMHYHFSPEVFLQAHGLTVFEMPKEKVVVREGQLCIMPAGLPHREHVEAGNEKPFRNLVAGFYSRTLSLHFAYEIEPGRPEIEAIEFFDTPNLEVFLTITNHLVDTFHGTAPAREQILNGLLTALLGMFLNLVEVGSGNLNRDIEKIFQAKWLVREQISNPKLNVKNLAERLHCSPDYLSHLFHTQTGEKLIHYIQRRRVEGAMMALKSTRFYISEIAWSSGFQDPAYFTRVFKKMTGESPQEFRNRLSAERVTKEENPKTIYYDRVDYSPGRPAAAMPEPTDGRVSQALPTAPRQQSEE